jgi:hypothetical protein
MKNQSNKPHATYNNMQPRVPSKLFYFVFIIISIATLEVNNCASAFTYPVSQVVPSRTHANPMPMTMSMSMHHRHHHSIRSNRMAINDDDAATSEAEDADPITRKRQMPKMIMNVYINYITKLWRQTDPKERKKVASQQALSAIKRVKHIMEGEEYVDLSHVNDYDTLDDIDQRIQSRDDLLMACSAMLECMEKGDIQDPAITEAIAKNDKATPAKKKKKSRSVLFGAAMGAMVACWVFSGNFVFTTLFTLMTALGQLEYYRMVMKTGIYPARRISVLGACSMFITVSQIQWVTLCNFVSSSIPS